MAQSMIGDILKQVEGNADVAQNLLSDLHKQAEDQKQKEFDDKVNELEQNFGSLGRNKIIEVLTENNWDVDSCIAPLFNLLQQQQEEQLKKQLTENKTRREEQSLQHQEEARAQANKFLKELFSTCSEEKILEVLDENDGDVDATTEQLLSLLLIQEQQKQNDKVKRQAEEAKAAERQLQLEQELKVDTLRARFGDNVTDHEVKSSLEEHGWDVLAASAQLLQVHEDRKKQQLKRLYPKFSESQIEATLNENNWDVVLTSKALACAAPSPPKSPVDKKDFMMRSALLGKAMQDTVEAERESTFAKENVKAIFKQQLEEKIRSDDSGPPGRPAPKPLSSQSAPVDESETNESQKLESPVEDPSQECKEMAGIELTIEPHACASGETVTVSYRTCADDMAVTRNDWIGLYPVSADDKHYYTYQWVPKASPSGEVSFYAPSGAGKYNARYFSNKSYTRHATSPFIHVGPQFSLSTEVIDSDQGKKVAVSYTQLAGESCPNAWIGLYTDPALRDRSYTTYEWCSSSQSQTLAFDVPKAGSWTFRLFPYRAYNSVTQTTVEVLGKDTVLLEHDMVNCKVKLTCNVNTVDPYQDGVWVGLFRVNEKNNRQWRRYKYIGERGTNVIEFKAPVHPGTYHARLFANKSYEDVICRSNEITIGHLPVVK